MEDMSVTDISLLQSTSQSLQKVDGSTLYFRSFVPYFESF